MNPDCLEVRALAGGDIEGLVGDLHRTFRGSDCFQRDLPWAVTACLATSVISVGTVLFFESLPGFRRGLLLVGGGALLTAFLLLRPAIPAGMAGAAVQHAATGGWKSSN